MADDKPKRQQALPRWLKPWVAVAAVLAILIVGYSGFLGTRYGSARSHVNTLEDRAGPGGALAGGSPEIAAQTRQQQEQALQQQQQQLRERLESSEHSLIDLIALISDTAEKTDVSVASTVFDAAGTQTDGQFQYGTQRVRLSLAGAVRNAEPASTTTSILGFLAFLGDEIPLAINSLSLAGLSDAPVADATLIFYMSAATTSPEE